MIFGAAIQLDSLHAFIRAIKKEKEVSAAVNEKSKK
jgi:hypothetical protein